MTIPTTLSERLPPLLFLVRSFPSPKCAAPLPGFLSVGCGSGGAGRPSSSNGVRVRMAWSLRGSDVGFEDKVRSGIVREADERHARGAVEALKAGKVIAVPTDTLYGFACDACSSEAVNRIYDIKGRKHTSPLAICVGDVSDIDRFAVTDHLPNGLLYSLLPGPVTVILRRGESSMLEKSLNPGLESIGVRVPDSDFIRKIAHGSVIALALTSANLSGKPSSVSIKDFEDLWEHCAFVYDGGVLPSGRAGSTIVDLTKPGLYRILRPGSAMGETVVILEKHLLREETAQIVRHLS